MEDAAEKIQLGLRALLATVQNWLFLRFKRGIKLNVGAGGTRITGYVNVDSLLLRNTELISDIKYLDLFVTRGSVEEIYASHILEHFSEKEVRKVLKIAFELLQDGGRLRISVPDIDKLVMLYMKHWDYFQQRGTPPWISQIYGGQDTTYDFHKTGFNRNWMSYLLEETGFRNVTEYDAVAFCRDNGFRDSSLYNKPFGEFISLNVIATK